jgi:hypothetical protein
MRWTILSMRDENENQVTEQAEATDPYGDVALGVECAWPQLMHLEQPVPTELQS